MSKTKHLDTAIAILSGAGAPKRAPRKANVVIATEYWVSEKRYTIQVNGKVVEEGEGTMAYAQERENDRATRIRALGKTVVIA